MKKAVLIFLLLLSLCLTSCGKGDSSTTPAATTPAATTPTVTTPDQTTVNGDPLCTHQFANECDATVCLLCGYVRVAPGHDWREFESKGGLVSAKTCEKEAVYHPFCVRCNIYSTETFTVPGLAPHTYKGDCDSECSVCHAEREAPAAHDFDENNVCRVCQHKATQEECPHHYAFACSTTCDRCGLIREASHAYHHDCDDTCKWCGEVTRPTATHVDADNNGICDLCGLSIGTEPSPGGDIEGEIDWQD